MIDTLLNIIAPHVCVVCGAENSLLCNDCGKKCISNDMACFFCDTPVATGELCPVCQKDFVFSRLTSVGWYDGALKSAIYAYKFGGKRGGAKTLAALLAVVAVPGSSQIVVYVPTSAVHIRQRGFDHSKLLAQRFAAQVSLPCISALARTNNHRQLGGNKTARKSSIVGAFVPVNSQLYAGKEVILLDDVITTGSTLRECAKVLMQAGAHSVQALVIAKTPVKR